MSSIDEGELYRGLDMEIRIPTYGLASGSLQITPIGSTFNQAEAYDLLQRVAAVWKRMGIDNYLVYRRSDEQSWEIVPYYDYTSFVRQLVVLAHATFGRYLVSPAERHHYFFLYQNQFSETLPCQEKTTKVAEDVFCQEAVIDSQLVLEGKYINVLYNYAPINGGPEQLHFLLVPKAHRENFNELTAEEFKEAAEWNDKLCAYYAKNGYEIAYQYHKTGKLAGQTVAHWHQHLVFVLPSYDLWGKLTVLFRMIMPPTPLSKEELETRVNRLQNELSVIDGAHQSCIDPSGVERSVKTLFPQMQSPVLY